MAIQTVNTSTDNVSDLCNVVNNNSGELITEGTSDGTEITLTAEGNGTEIVIPLNLSINSVIVEKGVVSISGTQADVLTANVQANSQIITSWQSVTAGTAGVLFIESKTPGVSFTIESTSSATGTILWMIIA